ncbi:sodium- and chloride-dependent glycine transporter 2-like isoform X5 [Dermacentor albipictus]|uniref:sodium- and chloride-dependent glycine transporter 2-like isoform X5 n=1 Tax=Dermacentor albipictus TaxID=60249 RepID=UPI0038FC4532
MTSSSVARVKQSAHQFIFSGHGGPGRGMSLTKPFFCFVQGIMEVAEQRDKWSYKVEFVFSCVALSLGLGNIWRFPYLTYQNGGAAFLVPYLLLLMVLGRPMYFLELILGQFSSSSTIKSFACLPLAQCLPMVMMYAVFLTSIYYNVISCYTLTYVYYSLWQVLPWSQCNPEWTNKYCFVQGSKFVAFVTVLVPFVMMVALLIRGATLTGVGFGTAYYLLPKWRRLLEYKVWQKAAEQVLISLGVAQGMVITMGSYNEFSNNANIDVYVIAVIDVVVSLVGGLVVFTVLGSMAFRLRVSMMDVLRIGDIHADGLYTTGLGLVFVAYPQAISTVSQPKLWAATFFAMLFLLTMGSQMAFVESLLSALKDQFENLHERRTTLAAVACCVGFLLGLPLTMQGGFYILNAIDTEVGGNLLRWIALFEIVYMIIGYGINRLSLDAEFMMDRPMGLPIEICWKFFCPILLLFVCISSIFETRPLTLGAYVYPPWVQVIGKVLFVTPVLVMAGGGVAHLVKWQGRWSEAVLPRPEWGPKDASTLLRYQLFLFDRAVLPPGKEWVDQEPLRKAALALGWQQHAEAEKDAVAAPSPASAGTVEAAQKEQMVEPSPAAVAIAGNSGNAAGAAKEVV